MLGSLVGPNRLVGCGEVGLTFGVGPGCLIQSWRFQMSAVLDATRLLIGQWIVLLWKDLILLMCFQRGLAPLEFALHLLLVLQETFRGHPERARKHCQVLT